MGVDKDSVPCEEIIYEVSLTEEAPKMPIDGLLGRAFDEAANMVGKYNGARAIVRKIQPLAPYGNRVANCVNLIKVLKSSLCPWVH